MATLQFLSGLGISFFFFSNLRALAFKIWNSAEVFVCTFEKNQILLQNFPWLPSPHSKVLKISFATFQIHHPYWSSKMSHTVTKPTKWHVRPAKTQITLGIHPVWSESSLCTQWVAKDSSFLEADSEDSDRLIWVFAGRTCHLVGFVTMGLKCFFLSWLVMNIVQIVYSGLFSWHDKTHGVLETYWHSKINFEEVTKTFKKSLRPTLQPAFSYELSLWLLRTGQAQCRDSPIFQFLQ